MDCGFWDDVRVEPVAEVDGVNIITARPEVSYRSKLRVILAMDRVSALICSKGGFERALHVRREGKKYENGRNIPL